jgi:hypothetical protein
MPGWPVRVYVSGAGQAYHASAVCPLLRVGQEKARERGHVVRPLRWSRWSRSATDGDRARDASSTEADGPSDKSLAYGNVPGAGRPYYEVCSDAPRETRPSRRWNSAQHG